MINVTSVRRTALFTALAAGLVLSGCNNAPEQNSADLDLSNVQGSSFDEPVKTTATVVAVPVATAPTGTDQPAEAPIATPAAVSGALASEATAAPESAAPTPAPQVAQAPAVETPVKIITAEELPKDISQIPTATPPPVSTTPVPAPAQAAVPVKIDAGEFTPVTFNVLSSFKYEEPIPQEGEKPEDVEKRRNPDQIPAEVKALDGKKAMVEGWMVPMEVSEDGSVKSFVLVKTQPQCCFGDTQAMNEWVDVIMDAGKAATFNVDQPIKVFGQLEVGEKTQDGFVLSIYRMKGQRVDI